MCVFFNLFVKCVHSYDDDFDAESYETDDEENRSVVVETSNAEILADDPEPVGDDETNDSTDIENMILSRAWEAEETIPAR